MNKSIIKSFQPTVTFVTAFIDLNEDRNTVRTPEKYISLFKKLASSGISICLYVSSKYETIGNELVNEFTNVKLMNITNLEDTETYKIIEKYNPSIPVVNNIVKDTKNYFILMNAKSEFVYNVSLINPFNTKHFAWIDFGICHMIKNTDLVLNNIYNFGISKLKDKFILFPCAWTKEHTNNYMHFMASRVMWRFCGSFFVGDKQSIQDMHNLLITQLPIFIEKKGVIVWEINIWTYLEYNCNWNIEYYISDHNDTILDIPKHYIIDESESVSNDTIPNDKFDISKYIDNTFYINLEYRIDRKQIIENELNKFEIPFERFNAIQTFGFGCTGCTLSHLSILKIAKQRGYKKVLILEDDLIFTVSKEEFRSKIINLYNDIPDFDVCMLGYTLIKGEKNTNFPYLTRVLNAHHALAYIVNETMYDSLINIFEKSIPLLESTKKHWLYACDQVWKELQKDSKWYCFTDKLAIQQDTYSDNQDVITINIYDKISKIMYINLESRLDRKEEIEKELTKFNMPFERFNAVSNLNFGALGCTQSHLNILIMAKTNKWKNVLILEDDFMFIVEKKILDFNLALLFNYKPDYDICMLSYNLLKGEQCTKYPFLTKVFDAQTTSGYLINEKMYDKMINILESSVDLLNKKKEPWKYAYDIIWKTLQKDTNWYCFTERLGIQRPSYSNIENRFCDYKC